MWPLPLCVQAAPPPAPHSCPKTRSRRRQPSLAVPRAGSGLAALSVGAHGTLKLSLSQRLQTAT